MPRGPTGTRSDPAPARRDDPLPRFADRGRQLALFHAHYDSRCFLPMHLYEATTGKPVAVILRPRRTPGGAEVALVRRHVVKPIRAHWPRVEILIRGDSHDARHEAMTWCEHNRVGYAFGLAGSQVLAARVADLAEDAALARSTAQPRRSVASASSRYMLRAGTITPEMHDAAKDFQAAFILPQLDTSRALPILRVPGPGHAPELNDRQLHARRRVHEALEALGRLSSPGARASGTSSACSAPSPRARFGKAGAVARVGRSRRRHPGGGARGAGAHFGHSEAEALLKDPCATLGDRLTVPGRKAEVGVTTTIAARGPEADFPDSSDPLLLQKRP